MNKRGETDNEFLQKLADIVEANLKNENFGVSKLALEMGISRSSLYLKVKAITKESVSRFICEFRLKRAYEILQQSSFTVSEVAYEVGFNSPSYFIKCFHDFYGFPPGEVEPSNKTKVKLSVTPSHYKKTRRIILILVLVALVIVLIITSLILK